MHHKSIFEAENFISNKELVKKYEWNDIYLEPANVVDGLFAIARAINRLVDIIREDNIK